MPELPASPAICAELCCLLTGEQLRYWNFERPGNAGDVTQRGIADAEFNAAQIGAVDPGLLRQLLLGPASFVAQLAQPDGKIPDDPVLETQAPSLTPVDYRSTEYE